MEFLLVLRRESSERSSYLESSWDTRDCADYTPVTFLHCKRQGTTPALEGKMSLFFASSARSKRDVMQKPDSPLLSFHGLDRLCLYNSFAFQNSDLLRFPQLFRIHRSCNSLKPKGFLPSCYKSARHSNHYVVIIDRVFTTCYSPLVMVESRRAARAATCSSPRCTTRDSQPPRHLSLSSHLELKT